MLALFPDEYRLHLQMSSWFYWRSMWTSSGHLRKLLPEQWVLRFLKTRIFIKYITCLTAALKRRHLFRERRAHRRLQLPLSIRRRPLRDAQIPLPGQQLQERRHLSPHRMQLHLWLPLRHHRQILRDTHQRLPRRTRLGQLDQQQVQQRRQVHRQPLQLHLPVSVGLHRPALPDPQEHLHAKQLPERRHLCLL